MLSDEQRQERREQLMKKHRKTKGGFVYHPEGRLRTLYNLYKIDPVLDLFLFKPKERKFNMSLLTRMPKHGDCFDRGSADAYYGRPYSPHWYPDGTGKGIRIEEADMTPEEIAEYREGYENETDRKDWG